MHLTTKALVLREVNYKEADKILTALTADEGKMTVSARGVRRKSGATAAACQQLCWGEFTLYEYQGRWAVKEAAAERRFEGVRGDLEKLALASYFAEVTETLAEEGQPEPELLSLTLNSLHALDKLSLPPTQVKTAFEWKAMALAGYEPMTDGCAVCGREPPESPQIHLGEGVVHAPVSLRPGCPAPHRGRRPETAVLLPGGRGIPEPAGPGVGGLPHDPAGAGVPDAGLL